MIESHLIESSARDCSPKQIRRRGRWIENENAITTTPKDSQVATPKGIMSDYASFVAAATQEKAIVDLLDENAKLQGQLRESKLMTITGSGGSPTYAKSFLDDAQVEENRPPLTFIGERVKSITLRNSTGESADPSLAMCQIEDVPHAEIRIGGALFHTIGRFTEEFTIGDEGDLFDQWVYLYRYIFRGADNDEATTQVELTVEYGPLPERFQQPGASQGPHLHANNEIEEVRFVDIAFHEQMHGDEEL